MTGGGKKRRDIAQGTEQANAFANQAIARIDPFAQQGVASNNQLAALLGMGGAQAQTGANADFRNSLFYTGGQNAFGLEKDAIDAQLSGQGLLYSQARLNAVEDARQRNFQNAFNSYLSGLTNQTGIGANAASGQANILTNQGQNAFNSGLATANTRQGVLGTLGQIANIGAKVATGFGGF